MYLNTDQAHECSTYIGNIVKEKSVNLIIIDDSFDTEERIVSSLRGTGYTARSSRVEDEEDLIQATESHPPDLVIYFNGMELINLKQVCECLKKQPTCSLSRVIAVDRKGMNSSVLDAMHNGAVDLVSFDNIEHLLLVIDREQQALIQTRKTETMGKSLRETERRCNSLLDSSRDAIAYIHEGMHIYSNQSYLELFSINESDELEGLPVLDMIAKDQREPFKKFLRNYAKTEDGSKTLQTRLRQPDGEEFEGKMELSPARIDNESCIQIIIRKETIDSEELEKQLKLLSQKDQLTGIFNRQYFIETLKDVINHHAQDEQPAVVMEIQLDNFDAIKKTVGISDADKYITAAAKALNSVVDEQITLARYTHSTFACIAENHSKTDTEKLIAQLQEIMLTLTYKINNNSINTTCSIGALLIDTDALEYNTALASVEKALQEATEKGVNQFCIHEPEKGELTRQEVDSCLKQQLTGALKNDNFILHFQPIVSLHGDTKERYEVFVRLRNTNQKKGVPKLIMPQDFFPAAERIGMATAIDRWVFYQAITHFTNRCKQGKETLLFLKLSAASIKDNTLIDWLSYQIKEKQLPANSLTFAVKESVAVTNLKHARELSQQLKKLKCGFILDDFGSGSNPFQLLQHIDADYLRIDPGHMEDLAENIQNQEHIKMIADRSAELGKLTIAQHVPNAASLSILWGMGINFIQGNFLQEPAPEMDYDFTEMSG